MGASQSIVSGHHHSHREGWQHRLKRDGKNEVRARCGICSRQAEIGEAVHRCRSCDFVVHDACYRLPKKINNLAHSVHPLTLGDRSRAPAGARTSCSICAVAFDAAAGPSYFVYGCTRCHGFYAHPRCCGLPPTVHNSALHEHTLTLLAPPPPPEPSRASGRHVRSSRRCVNAAGKCPNANRWQKNDAAWSYQCSTCNVELCLTCQMPGGGGPAPPPPCRWMRSPITAAPTTTSSEPWGRWRRRWPLRWARRSTHYSVQPCLELKRPRPPRCRHRHPNNYQIIILSSVNLLFNDF